MKDIFAERFKAERVRFGLTQDDIAEVCKNRDGDPPSRAAIAQWEKAGGTKPSFENLVAATRRMGTSIDYLVGLTDKLTPEQKNRVYIAADETGAYNPLSDEAIRFAQRWQRLPPPMKKAIKDLLGTLQLKN